jgi:hypothetical protein
LLQRNDVLAFFSDRVTILLTALVDGSPRMASEACVSVSGGKLGLVDRTASKLTKTGPLARAHAGASDSLLLSDAASVRF